MSQVVYVSAEVFRRAQALAKGGTGIQAKECVELLLNNDQSAGTGDAIPGAVNGADILAKALKLLETYPHAALGVPIGAKTVEIRKAYKKAALKFHPDKNPKTTPLFQAIQSACDKLSDREQRTKEEQKAAAAPKQAVPTTSAHSAASAARPQPVPSQQRQQPAQSQQQSAPKYGQQQKQAEPSKPPAQAPTGGNRFAEAYNRYAYYGAPQSQPAPEHNSDLDEARRRAKAAAEKRAEDMKAAAAKESQAQKDRDDILKQGQKAYFDEQTKLRRAAYERERAANEATEARRRAMYGAAPTATPDSAEYHHNPPTSRDAGAGKNSYQPSAVPGAQAYTASSDGKVKASHVPGASAASNAGQKSNPAFAAAEAAYSAYNYKKKYEVPVPIAFKCVGITETSVEIEWRISLYCTKAVLIELSWRRQSQNSVWQSAPKLISGFKCKKNNLDLSPGPSGSTYEFRVRAIEDLPGGMLGERSLWTETLVVEPLKTKPSVSSQSTAPSSGANGINATKPTSIPSSSAAANNLRSFQTNPSQTSTTSTSSTASASATPSSNSPPSSYHYVYANPEKEVVRPKDASKGTSNRPPSASTTATAGTSSTSSSGNGNRASVFTVPPIRINTNNNNSNGSGSKDKPSVQYPSYIFTDKVKGAEPPTSSRPPSATATATATADSNTPSATSAAAANSINTNSSTAAKATSSSAGKVPSGERVTVDTNTTSAAAQAASTDSRAAYVKPVRPAADLNRTRRHSSFVKSGYYGNMKEEVRSKVMEDLDLEIDGVVVDDDDGDDDDDDSSFEKRMRAKQPISPNCTTQANFSQTKKAWEDLLHSTSPKHSTSTTSGSAEGEQTKGNNIKENKTRIPPLPSRRHTLDGAESVTSSGKSGIPSPLSSPTNRKNGVKGGFRSSLDDNDADALYADEGYDSEEIEDEEELLQSMDKEKQKESRLGGDVADDDSIDEDSHSTRDKSVQQQHQTRPNNPGTSVLRPKQLNKKLSPPKTNSPSKTNSSSSSNTNKTSPLMSKKPAAAGTLELWYKLVPPVNVKITGGRPSDRYEHPVREEPLEASEEVGYLVPGLAVLAQAVVGDWVKVRYHKKRIMSSARPTGGLRADGWGWCLLKDPSNGVSFLKSTGDGGNDEVEEDDAVKEADTSHNSRGSHASSTVNHANQSSFDDNEEEDDYEQWDWAGRSEKEKQTAKSSSASKGKSGVAASNHSGVSADSDIDEWYERYDDEGGYLYYWNARTGESSWECPEWVEEIDPTTHATYYIQLNTQDATPLTSTWVMPPVFSRLYRRSEHDLFS